MEKQAPREAPWDLVIVGKYVITPDVFDYLKKAKPGPRGEIVLAEVLNTMIADGKAVYGYEFEGEWLECGTKEAWLKSNIRLALQHPEYGKWVRSLQS